MSYLCSVEMIMRAASATLSEDHYNEEATMVELESIDNGYFTWIGLGEDDE